MILSTPAIRSLARSFPSARIVVLASKAGAAALEGNPDVDEIIVDDPTASPGITGALDLARRLRLARCDLAVFLFLRSREAFAAKVAGIPRRIGPATKIAQIFLSRGVLQRRSRNLLHEAEQNLRLVEEAGSAAVRELVPPSSAEAEAETADFLRERFGAGIAPVIVHPGSGGSSINWPVSRYREAAAALVAQGSGPVVVTGSVAEEGIVGEAAGDAATAWTPPSLAYLTAIARRARLFISGSTGTMHLAAAAGCPTVSLFPPVFGGSPVRWGPIGNRNEVLLPPVAPPCGPCSRERCGRFNCMEGITVAEVLAAAARTARPPGAADRIPEGAAWRPAP
jgi:ADP-heptose:LPS heptosyltransferase